MNPVTVEKPAPPTSRPGAAVLRWMKSLFLMEKGYYAPEGQRPSTCAPATRRLKARDRRQAWQTTSRRP